jgi:type II secretory pathway predicted ATPase ExeA
MLLRKTPITRQAREHFGLEADPFRECTEASDVLLTPDFRYVREAMLDKIKHGGFLGVVGESGAGKSTLREALIDHLQNHHKSIVPIVPYMLASEANDKHGKTLKALHIAESIMAAIAPHAKILSSPEARFRQLHQALIESSRSGMRHVLLIEEAHSLPIPTLKHLKRFLELKDGLRPLLSVILIGQPELADKLSEGSPEVREVVQRIELVTLAPLDTELEPYLQHRFKLSGVPLARVFDQSGLDALRTLLGPTKKGGLSRTYPLMVHNCVARAMNTAADLGAPRVTADFVKGA